MGRDIPADQQLGPEFVPDKTRTAFLDVARALAAILVVYTHIYDVFIREHKGVTTPPTDALDNALVVPLKLDDQGIGAISVPIFFIISGFVVTPIALRMGPRRFGINRGLRIFPLLLFVVALAALLIALGQGLLSTRPQEVNVWTFLSNVSLWNFIDRPFGSWVAVAWTLAVEVLFYAMLIAVLPLLRKRAWLAIGVQLWVVLMLLITYRAFGDEYRALVINMVYTLIPIMGQAVWAAWARKIPAWLAGVFVTVAWLMFVWAGHLNVDPNYIPRPYPIAIAMLLFLLGLFAEPYLRQRRFWTELSERTYSIYLLHGVVAFPLMHLLFNSLPLWLTVLIAVVATGLASEASYRFVERPSHNLARRLSRRPKPEPEPEDDLEDDDYDDDDFDDEYDDYEDDVETPEDAPTEKTPPVALPPQRRRPAPWDRPAAAELNARRPIPPPDARRAARPDTGPPADRDPISARRNGHPTPRPPIPPSRNGSREPLRAGDDVAARPVPPGRPAPADLDAARDSGVLPGRGDDSRRPEPPAREQVRRDGGPPTRATPPGRNGVPNRTSLNGTAHPAARDNAPHRTAEPRPAGPPRPDADHPRNGTLDPAPHRRAALEGDLRPAGGRRRAEDPSRNDTPRWPDAERPAERLTERPTKRPAEHLTDRPVDRSVERPTERPVERLAERPSERPAERLAERPGERLTERPSERPDERLGERPAERAVERLGDRPGELPVERLAERPGDRPRPVGGRRRLEDREEPAATNGGRRRAEDILNGSSGGGRRRAPEPSRAAMPWPDDGDDPDGGGRHRST